MTATREALRPQLVEPVFVDGNRLARIRAKTYFVGQSEATWDSKRNFLVDRALLEEAAQLSFGGKIKRSLFETKRQLEIRDILNRRVREMRRGTVEEIIPEATPKRGKRPKELKTAAVERALEAVSQLVDSEEVEASYLARSRGVGRESPLDNIMGVSDLDLPPVKRRIVKEAQLTVENYARGLLNNQELRTKVSELARAIEREFTVNVGRGRVGSDLVQIAEEAKGVFEKHSEGLENIYFDISLRVGKADGGFATQEKKGLLDRLVEKSESNPVIGAIFNPTVFGLGVGIGAMAAKVPARYVPLLGGLAGAALAAVRRYSKEKKDRTYSLKQDELEIQTAPTKKPSGKLAKVLVGIVPKTDFSEFAYDLKSADDLTRQLTDYIDRGEGVFEAEEVIAGRRREGIQLVAEASARRDIDGLKRGAALSKGNGVEAMFTMEKTKFDLEVAIAAARTQLVGVLGQEIAQNQIVAAYKHKMAQILKEMGRIDNDFAKNRIKQAGRASRLGLMMGALGFLGAQIGVDVLERAGEEATVIFDHGMVRRDLPLGDSDIFSIIDTGGSKSKLVVELPDGYKPELDYGNNNLKFSGDGGIFEIGLKPNMTEAEVRDALDKAGLEAKISVDEVLNVRPESIVKIDVLAPEFLKEHNLVEISDKNWGLSFAKDQGLSLHQNGLDWSVSPTSGVPDKNLVAFYQVQDELGNWHTVLSDIKNGKFTIPQDFIDPDSGRVERVGVVGYGVVYDASGLAIDSEKVIADSNLINDGRLESMASVAFDQKDGFFEIPGQTETLTTVKVEDLTQIRLVPETHAYDINQYIPELGTVYTPRVYPDIAVLSAGVQEGANPLYDDSSQFAITNNGRGTLALLAETDRRRSQEQIAQIQRELNQYTHAREPIIELIPNTFVDDDDDDGDLRTFLEWAKIIAQEKADNLTRENLQKGVRETYVADESRLIDKKSFFSFSWKRYKHLKGTLMTRRQAKEAIAKWGLVGNVAYKSNPYNPLNRESIFRPSNWFAKSH